MPEDVSSAETRDVLWQTFMYLTSVPFEDRTVEWDDLIARVRNMLAVLDKNKVWTS